MSAGTPPGTRVGIVGARGHTGAELIRLVADHPEMTLAYAGSRAAAGQPVPGSDGLRFETPTPASVVKADLGAVFVATPDGASGDYVEAIVSGRPETVIVDISFDHRLDDGWVYGLPELHRNKIQGSRRVANPGCYATAINIALAPVLDLLDGVPVAFGVSGYSGAGSRPSPRNDPDRLQDNLMPYRLTGHNHEREAAHNLGRPIRFLPHVHPVFRGLLVTTHIPLSRAMEAAELHSLYGDRYAAEGLVDVVEGIPELRDTVGKPNVLVGGFAVSGKQAVVVAGLDNLLKGAAVQAMQNLNLALGLPELSGIVA